MNRLTPEERRRVRQVQLQAGQRMLEVSSQPLSSTPGQRWGRLMKAVAIAALIVGGVLASRAVEFHAPVSLVEALLPRM